METSSKDPLASAAEGVTKGVLSWTEEKIKRLVERFHNRDIAFVSDPETINLAKKQRKTSEWTLFRDYVDDPDLRILFQMGLTLRKLEKNPKPLGDLREKILNKYDTKGLHTAQFIQNGFFGKLLGNILERASTPQKLKFEIKNLFENIEKTVIFIQHKDDVGKKTEEIATKILANSPTTFIICGSGRAMKKCEEIKEKVMKKISSYDAELYKTEWKEIYFLNKSEEPLKQRCLYPGQLNSQLSDENLQVSQSDEDFYRTLKNIKMYSAIINRFFTSASINRRLYRALHRNTYEILINDQQAGECFHEKQDFFPQKVKHPLENPCFLIRIGVYSSINYLFSLEYSGLVERNISTYKELTHQPLTAALSAI